MRGKNRNFDTWHFEIRICECLFHAVEHAIKAVCDSFRTGFSPYWNFQGASIEANQFATLTGSRKVWKSGDPSDGVRAAVDRVWVSGKLLYL